MTRRFPLPARSATALAGAAALTVGMFAAAVTSSSAQATPVRSTAAATAATTAATHVVTPADAASLRTALRHGTLGARTGTLAVCTSHELRCGAKVLTTSRASRTAIAQRPSHALAAVPPVGYGADELAKAYGLTKAGSRTGTIVVIGAGAYPTLDSDLSIYRRTYGLPACSVANGCFKQVSYTGGKPYRPAAGDDDQYAEEDIAVETALDVDMASAACPKCKIISMQVPLADGFFGDDKATHAAILHFATGVQTAKKLHASAVSISYGYPTDSYSDTGTIKALMTQPGLPVVSSSGDDGFYEDDTSWPQNLATVTSAGGTSLFQSKKSASGYAETAWSGAGSGCSPDVAPAAGQPKSISAHCDGHRASSDLSAVADPATGVAVYDSYAPGTGMPNGFIVVGGTSASSPFIAGLYARAPGNSTVLGPNTIYAAPASAFTDVTLGSNGESPHYCDSEGYDRQLCDSDVGWDGPTGRGTPKGLAPFLGATK